MSKSWLCLVVVLVVCANARGQQDELPANVKERIAEIRDRFARKVPAESPKDRETTIAALAAIVKQESAAGRKFSPVKHQALRELGDFPDVRAATYVLIQEIDYGRSLVVDASPPIFYYPAAMSLIKIGTRARGGILGALNQPLPDHKLSLMVTVLVELDQDGDGMDGLHGSTTSLTMFRLTQELEQLKARAFAPEVEEDRIKRITNVKRMIALLLEPNFGLELPGVGVQE
ncbi:MAG TPA: hypothetical protein VMP01_21770 [Pirellulaceae bacterium]|nr:hypothetical protein [Pirellulaceae bacterium]